MKRNNIKQGFLSLAAACLAFTACTGDFERFNTDPNSAQEVDLKMFITTMQMDAVCESAERNAVFFFLDFSDKSVYIIAGSEIQFTGKLSVQCMFDGDINDCGATIDDGV